MEESRGRGANDNDAESVESGNCSVVSEVSVATQCVRVHGRVYVCAMRFKMK